MALSVGSFFIFVLVLGVLIFVHEFGHFITSKRLGVVVEEFGFGFPPRLLGVVKGDDGRWRWFWGQKAPKPEELGGQHTIYSLNWIPVGGFNRLKGEDDPTAPGSLAAASKKVRMVILLAGVTFNLIFAFLIFTLGFHLGWPDPNRVSIAEVAAGTPAAEAGLLPNDIIVSAEGTDITAPTQLSQITYAHLGQPVNLVVKRGDQTLAITVTPRTQWPTGQGPMGIVMGQPLMTDLTWPQAATRAAQEIYSQFALLVHLPGQLIRGEVSAQVARPIGLVGMNDLTRAVVQQSEQVNALYPILDLIGLLSVGVAISNLLPLPGLDGGRIVFVLLEAVRGRRIDPRREGMVHLAGMAVFLVLMVIITYQDIVSPIVPR